MPEIAGGIIAELVKNTLPMYLERCILPAFCQIIAVFSFRPVISQDYFTNLPLPQNVLERKEVATKERKK